MTFAGSLPATRRLIQSQFIPPGTPDPTDPDPSRRPPPGHSPAGTGFKEAGFSLIASLAVLVLTVTPMLAQATPVCTDTPATGERIECSEGETSTSAIEIDAADVDIDTSGTLEPGIKAQHDGEADMEIDVSASDANEPASIDTTGDQSTGVHGTHLGTGKNSVSVSDTSITTQGGTSHGVYAQHSASGDVDVDVHDATITTAGRNARGIDGSHRGEGEGAIDIDVRDVTIETAGGGAYGIYSTGEGGTQPHAQTLTTRRNTLTTMGDDAHGIWVRNETTGANVTIDGKDDSITTNGLNAHGVYGYHAGEGDILMDLEDLAITTNSTALHPSYEDTFSHGIYARHQGLGDIDIELQGGTLDTKGVYSYGIYGTLEADTNGGTLSIETGTGHALTTTGDHGHGIVAYHYGASQDTSNIAIDVGGSIHVSGAGAQGVRVGVVNADGEPERVAAIGTDGYRRHTVTVDGSVTSAAEGVFLAGGCKVVIGSQGSIDSSSGIAILATGTVPEVPEDSTDPNNVIAAVPAILPKLHVDLNLGGRRISQAIGDNWILNDGGETTIAVNNTVLHEGATGIVAGAVAHNGVWDVRMREEGVRVTDRTDPANWLISDPALGVVLGRDFSTADFNETRRPTPPRTPPVVSVPTVPTAPEPQVHEVQEPVFQESNTAAGVHVQGDGMVHIGPTGTIGTVSGIAILATQDAPESSTSFSTQGQLLEGATGGDLGPRSAGAVSQITPLVSAGGPKLIVEMDLDGRSVWDVIGDDWIINDGGETTIVINGVTLHEGATGIVADALAPNGPFNVAVIGEGVMVTDRTDPDPANWLISERTPGVIADRDFSTKDFLYLPSTGGSLVFVEEYAPRAALYEALPDFLLRMQRWESASPRLFIPDSPVWIRLLGSTGSQEFKRSTVGVDYNSNRLAVEAGVTVSVSETFDLMASLHHVTGSADVDSPTRGGDIHVKGKGVSLDTWWSLANDAYANARLSLAEYDLTLSSSTIGRLESGSDASGHTLHVEAGRRMPLGERLHWTPRAWLERSRISVDGFTDAVDARVSFSDKDRTTGGLGVLLETVGAANGGELVLNGSLDFEQKFGGTKTLTRVSGERLSAEAEQSSILLGLGSVWHRGPLQYSAGLSAREELDSGGEEYSGFIRVGMGF